MKKQSGAALIVVLSLLTISLMVGLSSMQSSQIDERLAGNYRAQAEAQMNAERGQSEFYGWLVGVYDDNGSWPIESDLRRSAWEGVVSSSSYVVSGGPYWDANTKKVSVEVTGKSSDGASVRDILAVYSWPAIPPIRAHAAFSCFGEECEFKIGAAAANSPRHIGATGIDHDVPEQCRGNKNPDASDSGRNVAGVLMPEGDLGAQGGSLDYSAFRGEPPVVNSGSSYEDFLEQSSVGEFLKGEGYESLEEYYDSYFETLLGMLSGSDLSKGSRSMSGASGLQYVGEGEKLTISGGFASGIVVLDGGALEMDGNECFSGLVISRNAGSVGDGESVEGKGIVTKGGTPMILGAVVGMNMKMSGAGNPSIFYSESAIGGATSSSGEGLKGGAVSISEWDS